MSDTDEDFEELDESSEPDSSEETSTDAEAEPEDDEEQPLDLAEASDAVEEPDEEDGDEAAETTVDAEADTGSDDDEEPLDLAEASDAVEEPEDPASESDEAAEFPEDEPLDLAEASDATEDPEDDADEAPAETSSPPDAPPPGAEEEASEPVEVDDAEIEEVDALDEETGGEAPEEPPPGAEPSTAEDESKSIFAEALEPVLDPSEPEPEEFESLPAAGATEAPATLKLYADGQLRGQLQIDGDSLLLGHASDEEGIDLADDWGSHFWAEHAAIYRHNDHYTLWMLADDIARVNGEPLTLGEHRELEDSDVIQFGDAGLQFERGGPEA